MPYIPESKRDAIIDGLVRPGNAGELNFLLTEVIKSYWVHSARNYQAINDISGAMTEALAEFRRRITVDYENSKIKLNGDCYDGAAH